MASIEFRCLTISANDGQRVMSQEDGRYRREYRVTVKSDATNQQRVFTFTDSIHNEERGKVGLTGDELLYAFRCWVEDGIAGDQSFADFCADYGYDTDSMSAHQTWKVCRDASRRLAALFHAEPDAHDIIRELSEMGIE